MPRASLQVAIVLALAAALASCGGAGGAASGPTIASISPSTVPAGGPAFTLTVAGTGFSGSVVTWNGEALATTVVSATELTAAVPAALIAQPGTASISVTNLPFAGAVPSNAVQLTIGQASTLSISKSHTGNFVQGQTGAHYTITVRNGASAGPTSGTITVADKLPAGLTATGISGPGWNCDLGTVSCTRSDSLPSGSSFGPITVTVNVAASAPATVTNSATLSGGGSIGAVATDVTTISPPSAPALNISKTHQGNFTQGQNGATYTITVKNNGSGATSGTVTVTDTLPAGLGAAGISGAGWACDASTLTCTRGDVLAPGSSYPAITLTVNVAPDAPGSVVNSASVSGGGSGASTANDPTTITPGTPPPAPPPAAKPVLSISKNHTGDFTVGQPVASYTIRVTNTGTGATGGQVTVTDTLPSGLTATGMVGDGWACNVALLACGRTDSLAPGAHYPDIILTVAVTATAPTTVTNSVAVSGGGSATSTATDPTNIVAAAAAAKPALGISKTHGGDFHVGDSADTYTIRVSNLGMGVTSGPVMVSDALPTGLAAMAMAGTDWSCSTALLACTRSDALSAGSSYPDVELTVAVTATTAMTVTNSATVSGGGSESATATDPTNIVVP